MCVCICICKSIRNTTHTKLYKNTHGLNLCTLMYLLAAANSSPSRSPGGIRTKFPYLEHKVGREPMQSPACVAICEGKPN